MGQKIHPTGFRLAVTRAWQSRWFANHRNFAGMLAEDLQVRDYLKTKLKNAAVSRILIERPAKNARITIFSARPGVVIGKKGEDIETLRRLIRDMQDPHHDAASFNEFDTQFHVAFSREAIFRMDFGYGDEGSNFTLAFGNSF